MLEKNIFIGGLDTDSDGRFIQPNDYRSLVNGRSNITGVIENIPSTEKIDFTLPSGTNKVIGSFSDVLNDVIIYFVWNSNTNHSILEYDSRLEAVTEIMQSPTLNFQIDKLINQANRVDNLLFWTDGYNAPREINISKAKAGFYGSSVTEQSISTIKYAPNCPPEAVYESSSTSSTNNLKDKLYQFKYKWIYVDNQESAWSAVSVVPIPNDEFVYYPFGTVPAGIDNNIKVTVNSGSFLVDRIQIAVRKISDSNAPGDFRMAEDLDKDELGIADDVFHEYTYTGENVEAPISVADSIRLFDFVPLTAETQEITDGNRLMYGGTKEGYDNVVTKISTEPLMVEIPAAPSTTITPSQLIVNAPSGVITNGVMTTGTFSLGSSPSEGDVVSANISIRIEGLYRGDIITYIVQAGDTYSDIIAALADAVQNSSSLNPEETTKNWRPYSSATVSYNLTAQFLNNVETGYGEPLINWYVDLIQAGGAGDFIVRTWSRYFDPINPTSYSGKHSAPGLNLVNRVAGTMNVTSPAKPTKSLKRGSGHDFGIIYYDDANRSSLIQRGDGVSLDVPYFSTSVENGITGMKLTVRHQPPEYAVKWQLAYGGRSSVGNFVQTEIQTVAAGSNGEFTGLIDRLNTYNNDIDGVVGYSFVKGDRLRVIKDTSDAYLDDFIDVEIVSYDSGTYTLTFKGHDSFVMTNALMVEIYSPRAEEDDSFFYEVGRCYPIRNAGTSTRAHGTNGDVNYTYNDRDQYWGVQDAELYLFDIGDVYFKERQFAVKTGTPRTRLIEDPNYSDFYTSSVWDKGRANLQDKNFSQKTNKARIFFSESLIQGSKINGLNTFYDVSFKDFDVSNGAIKRLYSEDSQLLVFQELKVGKSLINENLLYDSSGNPAGTVGQQNQVLSDMIYYAGEYGIGNNPESFIVFGNKKYFIDAERGAVLRLGLEGLTPISSAGRRIYFTDKFKELLKRSKDFNAYGGYDTKNDEYILSLEAQPAVYESVPDSKGGFAEILSEIKGETLAYSEGRKRWTHEYEFLPDFMSRSMIELFSFKDGEIYKHPLQSDSRNNFYGVQYDMRLTFVSNELPSEVKFYKGIITESSTAFSMTSAVNDRDQSTSLLTTDFELREGVYYAAMLRDENTPNVSNPILNGDEMRGHSLDVTLSDDSATAQTLFSVGVRFEPSMLANS
jgi:hypothetical protein